MSNTTCHDCNASDAGWIFHSLRFCQRCATERGYRRAKCPTCPTMVVVSPRGRSKRLCSQCYERRKRKTPNGRCSKCHAQARLVRGLCARDDQRRRLDSLPLKVCLRCGKTKHIGDREICHACEGIDVCKRSIRRYVKDLAGDVPLSAAGKAIVQHLCENTSQPQSLSWLNKLDRRLRRCLQKIVTTGVVTWNVFDRLAGVPGSAAMRKLCLRADVLRPRPDLDRVERRLVQLEASSDVRDVALLRRYWHDYLFHRVKLRARTTRFNSGLGNEVTLLNVAFKLIQFAASTPHKSVRQLSQCDLDEWLEHSPRSYCERISPFLRWLASARELPRRLHTGSFRRRRRRIDIRAAVATALRSARTNETLDLGTRVAALLEIEHGRLPHELSPLMRAAVDVTSPSAVWVRYGRGLSQPLVGEDAQLVLRLIALRKDQNCVWLFRSLRRRERPLTPAVLGTKIRAVHPTAQIREVRRFAIQSALESIEPLDLSEVLGLSASAIYSWQSGSSRLSLRQKNELSRLHASRKRSQRAGSRPA
jgi:hypothetical protein